MGPLLTESTLRFYPKSLFNRPEHVIFTSKTELQPQQIQHHALNFTTDEIGCVIRLTQHHYGPFSLPSTSKLC